MEPAEQEERTEQKERDIAAREVDEWIAERDISTLEFRPGDVWGSQLVDDLVAGRIIAAWTRSTPEGAEFSEHFNDAANRGAIRRAFESLQLPISFRTLGEVFGDLKASGRLRYVPNERERAKAERESQLAGYRKFYRDATAAEIKRRAKEDGEFDQWLKGRIARETGHADANKSAGAGAAIDTASIDPAIIEFARKYHAMTADQVRAARRDLDFVRKTEQAIAAGLI